MGSSYRHHQRPRRKSLVAPIVSLRRSLRSCSQNFLKVLQVYGDGNCLFLAVSQAISHAENHHFLLHLLTTIELCLNRSFYDIRYKNYVDIICDNRVPREDFRDIVTSACHPGGYVFRNHVFAFLKFRGQGPYSSDPSK